MMQHKAPYVLKRESSKEVLFEAAYVKHYYEGFCALFEKYPSTNTTVWLCRKLDFRDTSYGFHLCELIRQYEDGNTRVGYYIFLCQTSSEAEATQAMQANISSRAVLQAIAEDAGL